MDNKTNEKHNEVVYFHGKTRTILSPMEFEKLYNDHSERTLEMRKEFEDFIIQNKDNDVHVVVTIDNYELTSHIKRKSI